MTPTEKLSNHTKRLTLTLYLSISPLLLLYHKHRIGKCPIVVLFERKTYLFQRVLPEAVQILLHNWFYKTKCTLHLPRLAHIRGIHQNHIYPVFCSKAHFTLIGIKPCHQLHRRFPCFKNNIPAHISQRFKNFIMTIFR